LFGKTYSGSGKVQKCKEYYIQVNLPAHATMETIRYEFSVNKGLFKSPVEKLELPSDTSTESMLEYLVRDSSSSSSSFSGDFKKSLLKTGTFKNLVGKFTSYKSEDDVYYSYEIFFFTKTKIPWNLVLSADTSGLKKQTLVYSIDARSLISVIVL